MIDALTQKRISTGAGASQKERGFGELLPTASRARALHRARAVRRPRGAAVPLSLRRRRQRRAARAASAAVRWLVVERRATAVTAVAAISAMVVPAFEVDQVRPRNRFHYPPDLPQALVGPQRDAALYRGDVPVGRA